MDSDAHAEEEARLREYANRPVSREHARGDVIGPGGRMPAVAPQRIAGRMLGDGNHDGPVLGDGNHDGRSSEIEQDIPNHDETVMTPGAQFETFVAPREAEGVAS